jgi:hypothetical protein
MIYCHNDPCESEAVHVVEWSDGYITPLCLTCYQAFGLGAAYEAEGNWRVYKDVQDYVQYVIDTADDFGAKITRGQAEHIIEKSYAYDDVDEAIVQFVCRELPKELKADWIDTHYELAMDK